MKPETISEFMKAVGSTPGHQHRPGWVVGSCPFAFARHSGGVDHNPSFGIDERSNGLSRYHCFSCNSSGDLGYLVTELRVLRDHERFPAGIRFKDALQLIAVEEEEDDFHIADYDEQPPKGPPEQVVFDPTLYDSWPPVDADPVAAAYLRRRHVGPKRARSLGVKYDPARRRAVFPIRDWTGRLMGLHGRDVTGQSSLRWYAYKDGVDPVEGGGRWNKLVWYGEHWLNVDYPVLMVESIFDLMSVQRFYGNACCPLLAGMSRDKVRRMAGLEEVVTLFDHGTGGDAARLAIDKHLQAQQLTHLIPTAEQDDPGAMTVDDLYPLLAEHLSLDLF